MIFGQYALYAYFNLHENYGTVLIIFNYILDYALIN
jgi:hypothetical protein